MDYEARLKALEEYCFRQTNQFQTDVLEAVLRSFEAGIPLGIGKRIAQDYPAILAAFSPNKGIGFPVMTEEKRDEVNVTDLTPGIVVFNSTQGLLNQWDGENWLSMGIAGYTTVERDALTNPLPGQTIFNTTTNQLNYYDGTVWRVFLTTGDTINQPLVLENMTTGQRDAIVAPLEGRVIMNTTTDKINVYNGATWEAVTSV